MEEKFDFRSITSFEDACKKEGVDPTQLPDVSMIDPGMGKALIAAYKLFIVFKVINGKWIADWNDPNQNKFFPWLEIKADEARPGGFGFSCSYCDYWCTDTGCGSRLCTYSTETALYIAETFENLYIDFMLIQ